MIGGNNQKVHVVECSIQSVTACDSQPRNMDHVSVGGINDKNFIYTPE